MVGRGQVMYMDTLGLKDKVAEWIIREIIIKDHNRVADRVSVPSAEAVFALVAIELSEFDHSNNKMNDISIEYSNRVKFVNLLDN